MSGHCFISKWSVQLSEWSVWVKEYSLNVQCVSEWLVVLSEWSVSGSWVVSGSQWVVSGGHWWSVSVSGPWMISKWWVVSVLVSKYVQAFLCLFQLYYSHIQVNLTWLFECIYSCITPDFKIIVYFLLLKCYFSTCTCLPFTQFI